MGMNIFRLAGDMSHVFSIIVLLLRLRVARNAQGKNEKLEYWQSANDVRATVGLTVEMLETA